MLGFLCRAWLGLPINASWYPPWLPGNLLPPSMESFMARIPRYLDTWQKRTAKIEQENREALADSMIHNAYLKAINACRQVATYSDMKRHLTHGQRKELWPDVATALDEWFICLDQLEMLISERVPLMAARWGAHLRERLQIWICNACGIQPPEEKHPRTERLSPHNPILRLAENIYYIPEDINAFGNAIHRREYLLELDGYLRSIQEAKKPGRPPKAPNAPIKHRSRNDPERDAKAIKAYQMDQAQKERGATKMEWQKIAQSLGISIPPGDQGARKRIASQINRLVYRGRILSEPFTKKVPREK
jgi:hypothetical protein